MALVSSKLAARRMLAITVLAGIVGACLPGSFYLIGQGWGQPLQLAAVLAPLLSAAFTWALMAPQRHLHPIVLPLSLWCLTATAAGALPLSSAGHEMALVTAALAYIAYKHERHGLARVLTLALGVALACIQAQALMQQRRHASGEPQAKCSALQEGDQSKTAWLSVPACMTAPSSADSSELPVARPRLRSRPARGEGEARVRDLQPVGRSRGRPGRVWRTANPNRIFPPAGRHHARTVASPLLHRGHPAPLIPRSLREYRPKFALLLEIVGFGRWRTCATKSTRCESRSPPPTNVWITTGVPLDISKHLGSFWRQPTASIYEAGSSS